ncbi:MAG TPA: hypothetical protein VGG45_13725 [Terracidiphilus sp.]|jgi:hypothetical protein
MRQVTRCVLMAALLSAFSAAVAGPQEQIDRSRNPSEQALLMPQPKHVKLLVVGDDGAPMSKVAVEHANHIDELTTAPDGTVEFNTSAPYFVLGKPGYESVRLATESTATSRVALHKLPGGEQFRVCFDAELSARAPGWNGIFQVPKSKARKARAEKRDVDYVARVVTIKSRSKRLWVEQGRGPMWGGGIPEDSDVWKATRYREVTYKLGDLPVVDAKEWMPDGKCMRSVGLFTESILYYGLDCESTQPLDDLVDQACAIPDAAKHPIP